MKFNIAQQALIDAPTTQKVVGVAGAGTGKTTTILERTRRILDENETGRALLISFTRAAAKDLRDRLLEVLPEHQHRRVVVGTFHSVLANLIQEKAVAIGLSPNFSIIDENSTKVLYKQLIEQSIVDNIDVYNVLAKEEDRVRVVDEGDTRLFIVGERQSDRLSLPRYMVNMLTNMVGVMVNTSEPSELRTGQFSSESKRWIRKSHAKIYQLNREEFDNVLNFCYQIFFDSIKQTRITNTVTYDQILFFGYLMSENGMLDQFAKSLCHMIVDEYQDSNRLQDAFVCHVGGDHLTLIGDLDQSIYQFRGGKPEMIVEHAQSGIPINLTDNYRSYKPILDYANTCIENNKSGETIRKPLNTPKAIDEDYQGVVLVESQSDTNEAEFIIQKIKHLYAQGTPLEQIAVLIRERRAYIMLSKLLGKEKIPVNDTTNFADLLKSDVVVDMLNFIKIYTNPKDIYAFLGIIDRPKRNIGPKKIEQLQENAIKHEMGLVEYILSDKIEELTPAFKKNVKAFADIYRNLLDLSQNMSFKQVVLYLLQETGYVDWIRGLENNATHLLNIDLLKDMVSDFEDNYRKEHPKATTFDVANAFTFDILSSIRVEGQEGVVISTIHSAKGLEWDHVFIVGNEQGIFPGLVYDEEDMESERRLMYVALTRAKKGLTLCYSKFRVGMNVNSELKKSQFLNELNIQNIIRR